VLKEIRSLTILAQLGWLVALSVLLPLGLGLFVDRRLSTSPLFILIGALLGIVIATIGVVRIATRSFGNLSVPAGAGTREPSEAEDEA
jgi:F0F1-type ATP synthase assembly protein I